ncbi:hypothetical protein [Granulicella arctica]|uniref:DUF1871 family protein n=1 Tax=Granulicella arctica TaxID=940613 RepID=A0A7Y9PF91_9BACT|nr:hypothetical protein [Granulicella arctica]NYF78799.1 hypothetical protein [Granulicella arctica]
MDIRYPVMPKEESREVRRAIRKIFIEVWDPIGVMADPEWPRDEYDSYIGEVFELLVSNASTEELMDYLFEVVNERMGMSPPHGREDMKSTAEALKQLVVI